MKVARWCVVSAIVLILCYSALWYYEGDYLQKRLQTEIAKLVQENPLNFKCTYKTVEKSGFPFDIYLSILNPKILYASGDTQTDQLIECCIDGAIQSRFSLLGQLKSIESFGNYDFSIPANTISEASHLSASGKIILNTICNKSIATTISNLFQEKLPEIDGFTLALNDLQLSQKVAEADLVYLNAKRAFVQYENKKTSCRLHVATDFSITNSYAFISPSMDPGLREHLQFISKVFANNISKDTCECEFDIEMPHSTILDALAEAPLASMTETALPVSISIQS